MKEGKMLNAKDIPWLKFTEHFVWLFWIYFETKSGEYHYIDPKQKQQTFC